MVGMENQDRGNRNRRLPRAILRLTPHSLSPLVLRRPINFGGCSNFPDAPLLIRNGKRCWCPRPLVSCPFVAMHAELRHVGTWRKLLGAARKGASIEVLMIFSPELQGVRQRKWVDRLHFSAIWAPWRWSHRTGKHQDF